MKSGSVLNEFCGRGAQLNSIEKCGNALAVFGIGILGGAIGSRIPALGILKGGIIGALSTLSLFAVSGCEEKITYMVNQCPDGSVLPVTFEIDCFQINDENKDCKTYLENTACNIYPAFQKITQLSLSNRCSSLWYGIFPKNKWIYSTAGFSNVPACEIFWIDTHSVLSYKEGGNKYDFHEILHQIHYQLPLIDSLHHSLFETTILEAQRLGDPASYPAAFLSKKADYEDFLTHPDKVKDCLSAQTVIEEGLYFKEATNIHKIYSFLKKTEIKNSEIALSSVLYTVSGKDRSVQEYLLNHRCAKF